MLLLKRTAKANLISLCCVHGHFFSTAHSGHCIGCTMSALPADMPFAAVEPGVSLGAGVLCLSLECCAGQFEAPECRTARHTEAGPMQIVPCELFLSKALSQAILCLASAMMPGSGHSNQSVRDRLHVLHKAPCERLTSNRLNSCARGVPTANHFFFFA